MLDAVSLRDEMPLVNRSATGVALCPVECIPLSKMVYWLAQNFMGNRVSRSSDSKKKLIGSSGRITDT